MPRHKTKHTQILSERVRKSTFKRRLDSLFKKAKELSILCGVEIVVIVYDPKEGHTTTWPSHEQASHGVLKFLDRLKEPGPKKVVLQDKFLDHKLKGITERLLKLQKKNQNSERRLLMNQILEGGAFNDLDLRQLNGLDQFVTERLKKLQSRYDELAGVQRQLPHTENPHHFQMPAAAENTSGGFTTTSMVTVTGDMAEDRLFGNPMTGFQNSHGISRGINIQSTDFGRSFVEGNQGGVTDEFGRVWPAFFYP